MNLRLLSSIFKDAFKGWADDNITSWSAALSYYTAFSLSPLLLLVISLISVFVSRATIQQELSGQFQGLIGSQGANLINDILQNAKSQGGGVFATVISFIFLALGASGVFGQLKSTLNTIFGVEPKPHQGVLKVVKDRFLSFSMIIVISFLLIVSLAASAGITIISSYFTQLLPISGLFLETVNFLFSIMMIAVLFMIIFRVLPDVRLPRNVLFFGSVTTALLFTIGKTLIGIYLGRGTTSAFGAAASLATLLLWIYYSSLIFFFGAELMKSYAANHKIILNPKKNATLAIEEVLVKPQIKETDPIETILSYIFSGVFIGIFSKLGLTTKNTDKETIPTKPGEKIKKVKK